MRYLTNCGSKASWLSRKATGKALTTSTFLFPRQKTTRPDRRHSVTFNTEGKLSRVRQENCLYLVAVCPYGRRERRFERNGRLSLFLLPAGCSVDIIAVHVSPTGADWLDGRDQQKVTDVKLVRVAPRFRPQRP